MVDHWMVIVQTYVVRVSIATNPLSRNSCMFSAFLTMWGKLPTIGQPFLWEMPSLCSSNKARSGYFTANAVRTAADTPSVRVNKLSLIKLDIVCFVCIYYKGEEKRKERTKKIKWAYLYFFPFRLAGLHILYIKQPNALHVLLYIAQQTV